MNKREIENPIEMVEAWKSGTPIDELQRRYKAAYPVIHRVLMSCLRSAEYARIKKRHLADGGKATRFYTGQAAWNKGIHFDSGGRSHETRFKPGHIRGSAARRYRPVGFISVRYHKSKLNGETHGRRKIYPYHWIKIKDSGPPQYCWVQYARYIYEKTYGRIPEGYFPVHKDGDTLNDDPCNLMLVTQADNMRHNGHSPEVRIYAHARAVEHRKQNTLIRKMTQPDNTLHRFECFGCGWSGDEKPESGQCAKCGGGIVEQAKVKVA